MTMADRDEKAREYGRKLPSDVGVEAVIQAEIAYADAHRSRDAEVRELVARVSELESALDYVQRRCTLYGAADQARAKIDDVLAESRSEVRELVEALWSANDLVLYLIDCPDPNEEPKRVHAFWDLTTRLLARYEEDDDA